MPPLIVHSHLYERIDPATGDRLASSRVAYDANRWVVLDADDRPLSTHADSREARHAARSYLAGLAIEATPEWQEAGPMPEASDRPLEPSECNASQGSALPSRAQPRPALPTRAVPGSAAPDLNTDTLPEDPRSWNARSAYFRARNPDPCNRPSVFRPSPDDSPKP